MERVNGNSNWRQKINRLNKEYLMIIRDIGAEKDEYGGYAPTMLSLDGEMINLIMNIDAEVIDKIACVGVPLFRLNIADVQAANDLCKKGLDERLASLLTTAMTAGNRGMEGEA